MSTMCKRKSVKERSNQGRDQGGQNGPCWLAKKKGGCCCTPSNKRAPTKGKKREVGRREQREKKDKAPNPPRVPAQESLSASMEKKKEGSGKKLRKI